MYKIAVNNRREPMPAKKETKIQKIQRLYGPDKSTATLAQTAAWLRAHSYPSLADLLNPQP